MFTRPKVRFAVYLGATVHCDIDSSGLINESCTSLTCTPSRITQSTCAKVRVTAMSGLWAVPVTRSRLAPKHMILLRRLILQLAQGAGVRKSNRGGWHSTAGQLLDAASHIDATSWLSTAMLEASKNFIHDVTGAVGRKGEVRLKLVDAWANVNHAGHGNVVHTHPGLISGTLYVDVGSDDASTFLCFADPRSGVFPPLVAHMEEACHAIVGTQLRAGATLMDLRSGDIVIFPAWLPHHVPPHQGNRPRISIAFNVRAEVGNTRKPFRIVTDPGLPFGVASSINWLQPPWRQRQLFNNVALRFLSDVSISAVTSKVPALFSAQGPSSRDVPEDVTASLTKSGAVGIWWCLGSGLIAKHGQRGLALDSSAATTAWLSLPKGFVQTDRVQGAAAAGIAASGLHVMYGSLKLWMYDPRPMVEAAAASDAVARHLFGRKVAMQLTKGEIVVFPPWLEVSIETEMSPAIVVSFGLKAGPRNIDMTALPPQKA